MKNNRKDKNWLNNPDQIKTPKVFQVNMIRDTDGSFHLIGGETLVLMRKNQHSAEWVNVDTRDLSRVLKRSRITAR